MLTDAYRKCDASNSDDAKQKPKPHRITFMYRLLREKQEKFIKQFNNLSMGNDPRCPKLKLHEEEANKQLMVPDVKKANKNNQEMDGIKDINAASGCTNATHYISFHTPKAIRKEIKVSNIWEASICGSIEDVNTLINFEEVNPNIVDIHGVLPLGYACANSNTHVARILLDAGANPNAIDSFGDAPIHIACRWSDVQTVDLLLRYGADCSMLNTRGLTALDEVAERLKENKDQIIGSMILHHLSRILNEDRDLESNTHLTTTRRKSFDSSTNDSKVKTDRRSRSLTTPNFFPHLELNNFKTKLENTRHEENKSNQIINSLQQRTGSGVRVQSIPLTDKNDI